MKKVNVIKASKSTSNQKGKAKQKKGRFLAKLTKTVGKESVFDLPQTLAVLYTEKPTNIPQDHWELPISIKANGKFATLADYGSKPNAVSTLESLSGEQIKELIVERIKRQPSYPTRLMLGFGEVNREKAIQEVIANSSAGKFIIESEQRVIKMMKSEFEEAKVQP